MQSEPTAARRAKLFAHPEDKHCAIYNVLVLCAYGLAFWIYRNPARAGIESAWDRAAYVIGAAFLLGWISGINVGINFHNHCHRPIFRSARPNLWFERIWAFTGGWPALYWRHAHVTVHHQNLLGESDWTLPLRRPDGRFENIYRYVFLHWPWRYVPHLLHDFRTGRGGPGIGRRALQEGVLFLALWSIPFWIDVPMACLLWVLPHWIANGVIMGSGMYVQHAGCEPKSEATPYRHSNSFASRFFNLTMFNIGYHVVHHDYDQVHWSALPAFHRKLKARLIRGGVHVVPYGYYRAASLCSTLGRTAEAYEEFSADQAPGYGDAVRPQREETPARARAHAPATTLESIPSP